LPTGGVQTDGHDALLVVGESGPLLARVLDAERVGNHGPVVAGTAFFTYITC
jgi:hypothetical protein